MEILWTTAFIDLADDVFEGAVDFWAQALGSQVSARRGDHSEFATLLPQDGDSYVRVQRTDDGSTGIHLDLHVSSPADSATLAVTLGAELVADTGGVMVMRSPGGLSFCFVTHHGEATRPNAHASVPRRFDQLCIDVAPDQFDQESDFWEALTGWALTQSQLSEFRSLHQPDGIPLRFLVQRLDTTPANHQPHAHLDIACGDHMDVIADEHVALGATFVGRTKVWTQMKDPAGMFYCLTPRNPQNL